MRTVITSIVADAESAFDDGWAMHPQDVEEGDDASTRFRTIYLGGAGVVHALHGLEQRGFVRLRRDYIPYLERSLEAPPDFPDQDSERSLWAGETGIRLVLQRLAPSQANLERLSELIAANAQDERCELMWGSPGTILAGRELGLDVTASIEWLNARRDADGVWTQQLYGHTTRYLGPAHGFAGCVLALGNVAGVSETLQRLAVEEDGLVNWPSRAGTCPRRKRRRPDPHTVVPWRTGDHRDPRALARRGTSGRGRRVDVACRAAAQGRKPLPWHRGERIRISGAAPAHGRRTVANEGALVRNARRGSGGAVPGGQRPRPPHALDRRPRHGPLSRRLHRRRRRAAPALGTAKDWEPHVVRLPVFHVDQVSSSTAERTCRRSRL